MIAAHDQPLAREHLGSGDFGEIAVIDMQRGVLKSKAKSRKKEAPGNLLFYDGEVFSQTPTAVVAFPQLQVKIAEMRRLLNQENRLPLAR